MVWWRDGDEVEGMEKDMRENEMRIVVVRMVTWMR
jgi:hypothetical protein